jgi:DNA modification methylase
MNLIEFGDCRETMRKWKEQGIKAQTCVTSPPYFGLRDYGHDGQIGLEATPEEYINAMVEVFRCVWDVLEEDGTLWLNIGDSYCGTGSKGDWADPKNPEGRNGQAVSKTQKLAGYKSKDLIGIPWMLAFALRADGWYLRQDIIWHKPNPMPESVQDRCTKSHEYIFLLSKSQKYYYDHESIKEESVDFEGTKKRYEKNFNAFNGGLETGAISRDNPTAKLEFDGQRNKRSVWTITTKSYEGAHFATFPTDLIEPCILAGAPVGGIVLDPFMGSGTTAQVAQHLGRQYLGCELNPEYQPFQQKRLRQMSLVLE